LAWRENPFDAEPLRRKTAKDFGILARIMPALKAVYWGLRDNRTQLVRRTNKAA
jgi:hypothetical protein